MNRKRNKSSPAELWTTINQGIDQIIAQKDPKLLPIAWHATFYTALYDYMTPMRPREGPLDIAGLAELRLEGTQKYCGDIYCTLLNKFNAELTNILNGAFGLHGETLLIYYSDQWSKYQVMARLLDHGCAYFTRHWVKGIVQKRRDIYTVEALALSRWKVVVVDGLQGSDRKLSKALLDYVSSHRVNQPTDSAAVKSVLASLAILGRSGEHGEIATPEVYEDVFENVFLDETTKHYNQVVASVPVERRLKESWSWLPIEGAFETVLPSTASFGKLQTILKDLLVTPHAQQLETYLSDAIRGARHEDLKELYSFSVHHPDALELVRDTFLGQLFQQSISPTEEDADLTMAELESKRNPEVDAVYLKIVRDDFKMDSVLLEAFNGDTESIGGDPKTD